MGFLKKLPALMGVYQVLHLVTKRKEMCMQIKNCCGLLLRSVKIPLLNAKLSKLPKSDRITRCHQQGNGDKRQNQADPNLELDRTKDPCDQTLSEAHGECSNPKSVVVALRARLQPRRRFSRVPEPRALPWNTLRQ